MTELNAPCPHCGLYHHQDPPKGSGVPAPGDGPLTRIAAALERIASLLERKLI